MRRVAAAMYVRLAQLDRAFGYGPKGRGFESSSARYEERGNTAKYGVSSLSFQNIIFGCMMWWRFVLKYDD